MLEESGDGNLSYDIGGLVMTERRGFMCMSGIFADDKRVINYCTPFEILATH